MRHVSILIALIALPSLAHAEDFYIDPATGSPDGDGSATSPWRTLEEVIAAGLVETRNWSSLPYEAGATLAPVNAGAPIGPGDTIWLASGDHGALVIEGAYNEAPIAIRAMEGATPRLTRVLLRAASGWHLEGLSISASYRDPYDSTTLVEIDDHDFRGPSHDIVVEGCTLHSVEDTSAWSAADWVAMAANGIASDSDRVTVRDNVLTNVRFGISMSGDEARVIGNSIRNFSGDGMRGLGDDSLFERNYVANCYDVDDNHDDGFQSWSVGEGGVGTGEVRGMVLRGNVIVNYEDEAQPLRGTLQGIGCFDGFFVDWVVENNVIVVDHWHGITLLGARDSRIMNNTVIDPNDVTPGPPWISIGDHKDDTPSTGGLVRNNLTTALAIESADVVEDHNLVIEDPSALFVGGTFPFDLHLAEGSAAVDVGSAELAPLTDAEGIARPQGEGVDLGAYEQHEPGVEPIEDAGVEPLEDAGVVPPIDAGSRDAGSIGPGLDASAPGGDAGATPPSSDGCGCRSVGSGEAPFGPITLALIALTLARRRYSWSCSAR